MKTALFTIPMFIYEVDDWETKKKSVLRWLNRTEMKRTNEDHYWTDRAHLQQDKFYSDEFVNVFNPELQLFRKEADIDTVFISDIWFVEYEKGDYQLPHTHESSRYTGLLYVCLTDDNPPTTIVQPWYSYWGTKQIQPDVKEGTMMFIPSHLLHFSQTNRVDNIKSVLSFDLRS